MTPSADTRPAHGGARRHDVPLPPGLSSMWRLIRLGYTHEPGLLVFATVVTLLAAVPDALLALWLKLITDGVAHRAWPLVLGALAGVAASLVLTWLLRTVTDRITRRFRDKVTVALEAHVAALQATIGTIEHHERPDHLDRLAVLRRQVFVLDHMYLSVLTTLSWLVRVAITLVLLASVHPALVLLVVFAVPTVVSASIRPARERRAEEDAAVHQRLADHLFRTATTASAGKEVRITGIGQSLVADRRAAWARWYGPVARARTATAAWNAVAWAVFGIGFAGAVWFAAIGLGASAGDVVMVIAIGSRLSDYIAATVAEIGFMRGFWLDGARRLAWLEDYAAAVARPGRLPAPRRTRYGHRAPPRQLHLSRHRAGRAHRCRPAAARRSRRRAGRGERAGKSTLVKLLAKYYEPDAGTITVDGVDLADIDTAAWRRRMAGAFQDFHRFEFEAGVTVGLGDLPRVEDETAVRAAIAAAGADDVVTALPAGLATQLGPIWADGVDLSFGQWQKLALARGVMRNAPLVQVLDEPTADLDAETEHALFERYADAARRGEQGGITLLVSHRFSTVRMADLIIVLDGSRVAEVGAHHELMAHDGPYAQLYRIQEQAYR